MAHADLGFFSWNMGQTDLGAEETRKAYALRDRVSDRERLYILMLYDRQVTGNLQKELQTLESWVQTYPRDIDALTHYRGGGSHSVRANMKGEFKLGEKAIRVDPDMPFGYAVALHYLLLDRLHGGRGCLAAGRGAQAGNPGNAGHPLLSGVS